MLKVKTVNKHRSGRPLNVKIDSLGMRAFAGIFVFAVIEAGCDTAVNMPGSGSSGTVSYANDIQPIFTAQCINCHATGGVAVLAGIPLLLTEGDSYDMLVNQQSVQDTSLTFVIPGDSANSLLFLKVEATLPPIGVRMPLGGNALSDSDVALIRDWIDQGAMNN